jgi:hypothetical protein
LLDLLLVNGGVNRFAPASFYELRPEVEALLAPVRTAPLARLFSFGLAYSETARLRREALGYDSDVWLYYLDRQSLLPRTPVLDGLETAWEVDRDGLAPRDSALRVSEARASGFAALAGRLREANVRWVLSFDPLPAALAEPRGSVELREVTRPLVLYELAGALPRAFWTPDRQPPFRVGSGQAVRFERRGPHVAWIDADTPPGLVVVLEGLAPGWKAYEDAVEHPLLRVGRRYRALETPGGRHRFEMRYEPAWRLPSLVIAILGALALGLVWAQESRGAP